jgi:putative phosphoribosyl transferase
MMKTALALPETPTQVVAGSVTLQGDLVVPENAPGVVLFAHGSGSGRRSPRNRFVAERLQQAGLATLLIDLLTEQEDALDQFTAQLRFDIDLLADRLVGATDWLTQDPRTAHLPIGYFGASTGAGAALVAATQRSERIAALVSRGGRPDLAGDALLKVTVPSLFLVGSDDTIVIDLNRQALQRLTAHDKRLVIIPGASHLFEEPGQLDEVARLAGDWFTHYLHAPAHA